MRFLLGLIFVFALAITATVTPAQAQSPAVQDLGNIIFKEVEKRAIEKFFGKKAAEAVTGGRGKKAKKGKKGKGKGKGRGRGRGRGRGGGLPPGLQKQLERNGALPPGLAKRELPPGLQKKLGDAPPGLERVIAGDDVVLLEKATGKILDVIVGVLKGQ